MPGPDRLLDWPSLVLETEQTVADLCLLVALFSQKSEFRRALANRWMWIRTRRTRNSPSAGTRSLCSDGLERASLMTGRGSVGMLVFTRSCGAILLVAALAGFLWGDARVAEKSVYSSLYLAGIYMVNATLTYLIPLFFTLTTSRSERRRMPGRMFSPRTSDIRRSARNLR